MPNPDGTLTIDEALSSEEGGSPKQSRFLTIDEALSEGGVSPYEEHVAEQANVTPRTRMGVAAKQAQEKQQFKSMGKTAAGAAIVGGASFLGGLPLAAAAPEGFGVLGGIAGQTAGAYGGELLRQKTFGEPMSQRDAAAASLFTAAPALVGYVGNRVLGAAGGVSPAASEYVGMRSRLMPRYDLTMMEPKPTAELGLGRKIGAAVAEQGKPLTPGRIAEEKIMTAATESGTLIDPQPIIDTLRSKMLKGRASLGTVVGRNYNNKLQELVDTLEATKSEPAVQGGYTRLYRGFPSGESGRGPTEHERWFTVSPDNAKYYAKYTDRGESKVGPIDYVDVPDSIAKTATSSGAVLLPPELASKAKTLPSGGGISPNDLDELITGVLNPQVYKGGKVSSKLLSRKALSPSLEKSEQTLLRALPEEAATQRALAGQELTRRETAKGYFGLGKNEKTVVNNIRNLFQPGNEGALESLRGVGQQAGIDFETMAKELMVKRSFSADDRVKASMLHRIMMSIGVIGMASGKPGYAAAAMLSQPAASRFGAKIVAPLQMLLGPAGATMAELYKHKYPPKRETPKVAPSSQAQPQMWEETRVAPETMFPGMTNIGQPK